MKIPFRGLLKFGFLKPKKSAGRPPGADGRVYAWNSAVVLDMDSSFEKIFYECKSYTMTSVERMYSLYKAVEFVVKAKVPGDFVECGVWKGGSAMVMALSLLEFGDTSKKIFLYDTFAGMTKPSEKDIAIDDGFCAIEHWQKNQKKDHSEWAFAPFKEAKKNILSTGYPKENIIFVKGKVEETIPKIVPSKVSILRLDTDWFDSTYHELKYLFPLISKKGVLIIDDYGHFAGAKEAVDKYFKETNVPILLNRIDYTGRIGLKL